MKRCILKVVSVAGSTAALAHNRDRSIERTIELPGMALLRLRNREQAYFRAHVDQDDKLILDAETTERTW